jgi:hypothetical protein
LDKLRANNNDEIEALTMDRGDGDSDGDKKPAAKEPLETAVAPVEEKKEPAVE